MPLKIFVVEGEDYVEKKVVCHSNPSASYVYLPKSWAGKTAVVICMGNIISMSVKGGIEI